MPRKATMAAATIAPATTIPAAPQSASTPVVTRKRTRRAALAAPIVAPPTPIAIDLSTMTAEQAKKALAAAYPAHVEGKRIEASDADAVAALEYLNARDAAKIAEGRKEASGNVLRYAMKDAEVMVGEGWEATWKTQKNEIDWGALAKELNIPSATIERFRKPQKRVLNVRETAE